MPSGFMHWGRAFRSLPRCATGTSCIGEAYRAVKHGYADAAIAGGSEASITPLALAGFINCMALTTSADEDLRVHPL